MEAAVKGGGGPACADYLVPNCSSGRAEQNGHLSAWHQHSAVEVLSGACIGEEGIYQSFRTKTCESWPDQRLSAQRHRRSSTSQFPWQRRTTHQRRGGIGVIQLRPPRSNGIYLQVSFTSPSSLLLLDPLLHFCLGLVYPLSVRFFPLT